MAIKLLIGGSPCTHWSIAQKNNRETEPSGIGWELFKNYLIAKEKFKPDFFLYENNKSAAQAIKDQIAKELGVGVDPKARFTYINSALVSAQNRQRFYVTNFGDIKQPEDRGILLKDVLEYGIPFRKDKSHCIDANYFKGGNITGFNRQSGQRLCVAEPVCVAQRGRYKDTGNRTTKGEGDTEQFYEARTDGKTNALTTVQKDNAVAEPVRVGCYPSPDGTLKNSQGMRLYSIEGKSVNLTANGGGMGGKTGLYAIPVEFQLVDYVPRKNSTIKINDNAIRCSQNKNGASVAESFVNFTDVKAGTLTTAHVPKIIEKIEMGEIVPTKAVSLANGKEYPVYQVLNGQITIKGKQYPIKLSDGYYIIRKLTVTECCRLQTMPDDYCKAVSATQAYKGLGNGWTAKVIIHLLNHALKDVPRNEEIVVLSLYDGIGTGRYCLDKMGFTNIKYYAYEIDKYAMAIANDNYSDIIQCGDAFAVREDSWKPPKTRSEWLDELSGVSK
jgi:site-specific DNA-cytosine methylase